MAYRALAIFSRTGRRAWCWRVPGRTRPGRTLRRSSRSVRRVRGGWDWLSSNSVVGQRMAVSLGVERSNRFVDGAVEIVRSGERLMSEVMPLEVAPDPFNVVELRGVFRQPLDGEPVCALGERGAACLAGVDRAVVQDEHEGLDRDAELGTIATVDLLQKRDEVRASFGPAGVNNEVATRPVEHPEHRHFGALARRRNAQVGPWSAPFLAQTCAR